MDKLLSGLAKLIGWFLAVVFFIFAVDDFARIHMLKGLTSLIISLMCLPPVLRVVFVRKPKLVFYSEKFKIFYDKELVTVLRELEEKRKNIARIYRLCKLKTRGICLFWFIIICFVPPFFLMGIEAFFFGILWTSIWMLPVLITVLPKGKKRLHEETDILILELKNHFKNEIITRMTKSINKELIYSPANYLPLSEYNESRFFGSTVELYSGDDMVSGKLGETDIRFSEVHSEYDFGNEGPNPKAYTIFHGLLFVADFNKYFTGETFVIPGFTENHSGYKRVKLEDPEFNRIFNVNSSDQIVARYILSPSMMERIKSFKRKIHHPVYFSFINSKLFIAIDTGKMFEPPILDSLLNNKMIEDYYHYLELMTGITEELDLNTKIWTKEGKNEFTSPIKKSTRRFVLPHKKHNKNYPKFENSGTQRITRNSGETGILGWIAAIAFSLVGSFFLFSASSIWTDDKTGKLIFQILGGVFLGLGGPYLISLVVMVLRRRSPQNYKPVADKVSNLVPIISALLFGVPALLIGPAAAIGLLPGFGWGSLLFSLLGLLVCIGVWYAVKKK